MQSSKKPSDTCSTRKEPSAGGNVKQGKGEMAPSRVPINKPRSYPRIPGCLSNHDITPVQMGFKWGSNNGIYVNNNGKNSQIIFNLYIYKLPREPSQKTAGGWTGLYTLISIEELYDEGLAFDRSLAPPDNLPDPIAALRRPSLPQRQPLPGPFRGFRRRPQQLPPAFLLCSSEGSKMAWCSGFPLIRHTSSPPLLRFEPPGRFSLRSLPGDGFCQQHSQRLGHNPVRGHWPEE